jgi:sulfane dehydrogenase subunit SoxC
VSGHQAPRFALEELQLATRNHGLPLEAMRYSVTPAGLHYVLCHFDIPVVDPDRWTLEVGGLVRRPLRLSLRDLESLPASTLRVTFECAGNGRALMSPRPPSQPWLQEAVGTGEWTGVSLSSLLAAAELEEEAVEIAFTGLDQGIDGGIRQSYERSLPVSEAVRDEVLLAHSLNGAPLPPQHGFPLRLVVPGWYGMTNVKWLSSIRALPTAFDGYQQSSAYRLRGSEEERGQPLSRMPPRALMIPPGLPDFYTRTRVLEHGPVLVEGRAWSGGGSVESVEFSADGAVWTSAELSPSEGPWSWRHWRVVWDPPGPGTYELRCRARDSTGAQQPDVPVWNAGGYANNAHQVVKVQVTADSG